MSSLEEKLAAPAPAIPGRARATLAQLRLMWGFPEDIIAPPTSLVVTMAIGHVVEWRWILVGRSASEKSIYERTD